VREISLVVLAVPDEAVFVPAGQQGAGAGGGARARKMLREVVSQQYKERLRRYNKEWQQQASRRAGTPPLAQDFAVVAVQALARHAAANNLEYQVLGQL
jgi:hypothetical protein